MYRRFNLGQYINLTKEMAIADFKIRYQGSILGVTWSLLKPLMMFLVYYFVFSRVARFDIDNYPVFLFIGLITWNFFSETTVLSLKSLEQKSRLIKKINFPRSVIIISTANIAFINLLLSGFILLLFIFLLNIKLTIMSIYFIFPLAFIYIFTLGISFLISGLGAKYRDVQHIWEVIIKIGLWATPVVYSKEMIPDEYKFVYFINPIGQAIHQLRQAIIYANLPFMNDILILLSTSLSALLIGLWVFNKKAKYFAEEL